LPIQLCPSRIPGPSPHAITTPLCNNAIPFLDPRFRPPPSHCIVAPTCLEASPPTQCWSFPRHPICQSSFLFLPAPIVSIFLWALWSPHVSWSLRVPAVVFFFPPPPTHSPHPSRLFISVPLFFESPPPPQKFSLVSALNWTFGIASFPLPLFPNPPPSCFFSHHFAHWG